MYVTNIPKDWTEDVIKERFGKFGHISSIKKQTSKIGVYAYVCFGDKDGQDVNIGIQSAKEAIEEMDGFKVSDEQ